MRSLILAAVLLAWPAFADEVVSPSVEPREVGRFVVTSVRGGTGAAPSNPSRGTSVAGAGRACAPRPVQTTASPAIPDTIGISKVLTYGTLLRESGAVNP